MDTKEEQGTRMVNKDGEDWNGLKMMNLKTLGLGFQDVKTATGLL